VTNNLLREVRGQGKKKTSRAERKGAFHCHPPRSEPSGGFAFLFLASHQRTSDSPPSASVHATHSHQSIRSVMISQELTSLFPERCGKFIEWLFVIVFIKMNEMTH
jgi:hypothetical protein